MTENDNVTWKLPDGSVHIIRKYKTCTAAPPHKSKAAYCVSEALSSDLVTYRPHRGVLADALREQNRRA